MGNNKYKVLIVEDDQSILGFVQTILETNGYQVLTAERCRQGLLIFSSYTPDLVVLDLEGNRVEGELNPSSDTKTHLELYRAFPQLGGIVHTHSAHAVAWAQAGEDIPCFGTTHADYFYGPIPCARALTPREVEEDYEGNTGRVIVETFRERGLNPVYVPAVVCRSHGPFTWGKDAAQAVYHAVVLEEVAKMALFTRQVNPAAAPAPQHVLDKHFLRKHGPNAYYGQGK